MVTTARTIPVELEDNGTDSPGDYWTARHAITLAIRCHETALRGIARNRGTTQATSKARRQHEDALAQLRALQHKLTAARDIQEHRP